MRRLVLLFFSLIFIAAIYTANAQTASTCAPRPSNSSLGGSDVVRLPSKTITRMIDLDVDADGDEDKAFLQMMPIDGTELFHEGLILTLCQPGEGYVVHRVYSHQLPNYPASRLIAFQDLNRDGLAEIVVESKHCRANTCFSSVYLFTWNKGDGWEVGWGLILLSEAAVDWEFLSNLSENGIPLIKVTDANDDGYWEVTITGLANDPNREEDDRQHMLTWWFEPSLDLWVYKVRSRTQSGT